MKKYFTITGSQIFGPIIDCIQKDIIALHSINSNFIKNQKEKDFIDSLISAKKIILDILPENSSGTDEVVSPPSAHKLISYADQIEQFEDEKGWLVKFIYNVEDNQRSFVKSQFTGKGLPKELTNLLMKVYHLQNKIHDHLDRSRSTDQLGIIGI